MLVDYTASELNKVGIIPVSGNMVGAFCGQRVLWYDELSQYSEVVINK